MPHSQLIFRALFIYDVKRVHGSLHFMIVCDGGLFNGDFLKLLMVLGWGLTCKGVGAIFLVGAQVDNLELLGCRRYSNR